MLPSSDAASPNGRRKRPVPVCSDATPPDNNMQDGGLSTCNGDFPTDFSFSSTRSVRRRLSALSNDLQQPNSMPVVRSRKKRGPCILENSGTLSRRLAALSCSTDGGEGSASETYVPSNVMLDIGSAKRLKSCTLEFSEQLSHGFRPPSCSQNIEDLPQPSGTYSVKSSKKRKSSALEASRRLSRQLNIPSCSRDKDGQLPPPSLPVSSNGHRQDLHHDTR